MCYHACYIPVYVTRSAEVPTVYLPRAVIARSCVTRVTGAPRKRDAETGAVVATMPASPLFEMSPIFFKVYSSGLTVVWTTIQAATTTAVAKTVTVLTALPLAQIGIQAEAAGKAETRVAERHSTSKSPSLSTGPPPSSSHLTTIMEVTFCPYLRHKPPRLSVKSVP